MNSAKTCKTDNEMEIIFDAVSANESLARVAVAAFVTEKNPTLEELSDIKTAVSEAVTNAIIHGYNGKEGKVRMHCKWSDLRWKSRIKASELKILNRQWNLCLQQDRMLTVPEWAFPLWKHLWMN